MKRSGAPCVHLDTPNMSVDFKDRFPNVYENCMKRGIDPTKTPIPVVPLLIIPAEVCLLVWIAPPN